MSSLDSNHLHTNTLINETSPYLLQHAHNPVNWYAWNEKTLERATREGKMLIISIGYSACHWCHVMERESFEDEEVAKLMNDHFICIKVDREERPDIDQVYMHAVQLLSGRGGWPLNCFALPDGRPFYGGTYFSKEQWMQLLQKIVSEYAKDSAAFLGYAERLTAGVQQNEFELSNSPDERITKEQLHSMVENWKTTFDNAKGGANHAPKFPIPNNYQFLLRYGYLLADEAVLNHVTLTLQKMANGGIYDQLGGGFSRYATDMDWKVPHFEKMLYDNAQLVSLYAEAYQHEPNERYKTVVYQTVEFIKNEMTNKEGAFYSALDADSEGEEGKYYVWTREELMHILGEDFEWTKELYHIDNKGLWEQGNYILLRTENTERLRKKEGITAAEMRNREKRVRGKLLNARTARIRPGLDDKTLTSWNAMMIKGLVDAYRVFHEPSFLDMAERNAMFIRSKQLKPDGSLFHNYKNGRSTINGYLEDYAFVIDAFIALYQVTFDEEWLRNARQLSEYALLHFYDKQSQLFYFTSDQDPKLIARKMEVRDNVIPASNSAMAHNLFLLGHYFDQPKYLNISNAMLNRVATEIPTYGSSFSNWGMLALHQIQPFYEVAFVGKAAKDRKAEWDQFYVPNCLTIGAVRESKLPLLEHKLINGQTTVYVCENKTCQLPVTAVSEALMQLKHH